MSLSSMMEKWDTIAFNGYNIMSNLVYLTRYPKINKYLKENKHLKDKHKGKRCFIVLNGPSLNNYDLSKIKDEYVFCTNYFYQTDYFDVVKPNYYCVTDSGFFDTNKNPDAKDHMQNLLNKQCQYIFNINYLNFFNENRNVHLTYSKHMPNLLSIKNDLSSISSNFISVSLYTMNVAIYMGFEEIYLLGYDFEPGILSHFYKNTKTEARIKDRQRNEIAKDDVCGKYWQYTYAQYQNYYMSEYSKKNGVKIYNCNTNSNVRSFPFTEYKDLFLNNREED